MVWSNDKDLVLLKVMAAEGVLVHKQGSGEHGTHWQNVADNISGMGHEVTSRGVRDHFNLMAKKYQARMAREERSTGEILSSISKRPLYSHSHITHLPVEFSNLGCQLSIL